jgi:hypothetical protein
MPPWIFGCSVLTRPSIISGKPVCSLTSVTASPRPAAGGRCRRWTAARRRAPRARAKLDDAGLVGDAEQGPANGVVVALTVASVPASPLCCAASCAGCRGSGPAPARRASGCRACTPSPPAAAAPPPREDQVVEVRARLAVHLIEVAAHEECRRPRAASTRWRPRSAGSVQRAMRCRYRSAFSQGFGFTHAARSCRSS